MKSYDETISSVFEKIEARKINEKKKRDRILKVSIPAICLCLLLIAAVLVLDYNKPQIGGGEVVGPNAGGTYTGALEQNESDLGDNMMDGDLNGYAWNKDSSVGGEGVVSQAPESQENSPIRFAYHANKIIGTVSAAKLNFSEDKYYSSTKTYADLKEYFGKDFKDLDFSTICGTKYNYAEREIPAKFFYKNDTTEIQYDTVGFYYEGSYYDEKESVTILVSKIGTPYDCVYMLEKQTVTELYGVEAIFAFEQDRTNGYVDFSKDGVNYRILAKAENSDRLGKILYLTFAHLSQN